jgi:hypothetical protein
MRSRNIHYCVLHFSNLIWMELDIIMRGNHKSTNFEQIPLSNFLMRFAKSERLYRQAFPKTSTNSRFANMNWIENLVEF